MTDPADNPGTDGNVLPERRPRIVVAEDEFLVATMMEDDLTEAGFAVVGVAGSADAAVKMAGEQKPDLIVMDVRLIGQRDGIDAALEIHARTGIRCLFATAHGDSQSRQRAAPAQPLGWLQKPYDRAALLSAVEAAFRALDGGQS